MFFFVKVYVLSPEQLMKMSKMNYFAMLKKYKAAAFTLRLLQEGLEICLFFSFRSV